MNKEKGFTLIELLICIAIVTFIAALGIPEVVRFGSNYRVKSAATDLFQNIKLARGMAIKESRDYLVVFNTANNRYLIGHDGDGDNNLITPGRDTFGLCKDGNKDKYPDADEDGDFPGIPSCVKVVDLQTEYGDSVSFSNPLPTTPPNGPNGSGTITKSITFDGTPKRIIIRSNGNITTLGSVYFQQVSRGYTYCLRVGFMSGKIDLWRWQGDVDHNLEDEWIEVK